MNTTPTRLVPSRSSGAAKAAEDCRTPKASPPRSLPVHAPASWAAAALRRFSFAVLTVLALLGLANRVAAQAQVPDRLSFQGHMADANGIPLGSDAPVNYPVVFRIFSAPTGGTTNWSERQVVTFDQGDYSVLLGQGSAVAGEPSPLLSAMVLNSVGSELYVESTVTINGTDARILPRLRLLPTPYAFLAARAATADQALSVNGSAIAAGSIQQDRLSASVISNILQAPIPDSRLSANITSGPIADSRLSANITNGPIADSRLTANIPRKNEANLFTGDQTINGNLTVTNRIFVGTNAVVSGTGSESLRIVRGRVKLIYLQGVNWGYQVVNGANFTVNEKPLGYTPQEGIGFVGTGIVDIRFDPPFADIPAITVTRWNEAGMYAGNIPWVAWVTVLEVTPSQATVSFMGFPNSVATYVDAPFHFIAVGAR